MTGRNSANTVTGAIAAAFITLASLLPVSCQKERPIREYTLEKLSVTPGLLTGSTFIAPSLAILVSGPDDAWWEVDVTGDAPGETMACRCRTGVNTALKLTKLDMGAHRKEASVSVKVRRSETGELLAVRGGVRVTVNEETPVPPAPEKTRTVRIDRLVLSSGGNETTVETDGSSAAELTLCEGDTGELHVYYTPLQDDGPVTCTVAPQAEDAPLILLEEEVRSTGDGLAIIPFAARAKGSGTAELALCGNGAPTPLLLPFTVGPRILSATLTPDNFLFAEGNDARGTVTMEGFRKGERCRVLIRFRGLSGSHQGSIEYKAVDPAKPLRVTLWKAGAAETWDDVAYKAEVYGEAAGMDPVVSPEVTVRPLRPTVQWGDEEGIGVRDEDPVRSRTAYASVSMEFDPGKDLHDHIRKVTLRDSRSGKETTASSPVQGHHIYLMKMTRPSRGNHVFSVILDTDEGAFVFSTRKEFVDVWTAAPFVDGSSLYAYLTGPEPTLQSECRMGIYVNVYAHYDYTVAEEGDGWHTDMKREWWAYLETRHLDYTVGSGTGHTNVTIQSGWVNTAIRQLRDLGAGKPWPAQTEASRWVKDQYGNYRKETYTPQPSVTGVHVYLKCNEEFYSAGYDFELDISRLAPVLEQNGIAYF